MKKSSIYSLDVKTTALVRKKVNGQDRREEFCNLWGVWDSRDAAEFDKAMGMFEANDPNS